MHSVTVKITCDCSINDTSASGLSDLLYGIDDGQVDGSVEVVDHTSKCPCGDQCDCDAEPHQTVTTFKQIAPIKDRLSILLHEPDAIATPAVLREICWVYDRVEPVMTYEDVSQIREGLRDAWSMANVRGYVDLAVELASIDNAVLAVLDTLDTCEV